MLPQGLLPPILLAAGERARVKFPHDLAGGMVGPIREGRDYTLEEL